jgi:hypothetical protein
MTRSARGCAEARAWLTAHAVEDLPPLERAFVDAHLAHCPACAALRSELARGFVAARGPLPDVDESHLVDLVRAAAPGELGPPLQAPERAARTVPLWTVGATAFGVAASLALLLLPVLPSLEREGAASKDAPAIEPSYLEPTPHVRVVTAGGWVGKTIVDGDRVDVEMSAGEAAFSMRGGAGRALRVSTPGGIVEVVGTRFAVRLEEGASVSLQVSVIEGKVILQTDKGREEIAAGEVLTVDEGRRVRGPLDPEQPTVLHDPFLSLPAAASRSSKANGAGNPGRVGPPPVPPAAGLDQLLPRLEEAQRLGRAGDREAALSRYRELELDARFEPHRELIAYDRARLRGLVLGDVEAAREELGRLARSARPTVASEAALTRCELERPRDACAAVACLERIVAQGGAAAADARRLQVRWRVACLR